ncbi:MAG: hypothetical protein IT495_02965 [Gammaproteobacteria bacterium]|nr:hypothetical protein [Gammaproteobacteria bacterium]
MPSSSSGVLRTGVVAGVAGATLALAALAIVPIASVPAIAPIIESTADGGHLEQWMVREEDLLAVTAGPQDPDPPRPPGIARLADERLAATGVATMKLRDRDGIVVGVASRLIAPEADARAALWTFVLGTRGTLAAEVPQADVDGAGRLIGGTIDFAGVRGRFAEHARPEAGVRYRLDVLREP